MIYDNKIYISTIIKYLTQACYQTHNRFIAILLIAKKIIW